LAVMPLCIVSRHEDDPNTSSAFSPTFGKACSPNIRCAVVSPGRHALAVPGSGKDHASSNGLPGQVIWPSRTISWIL
jgi:hypothetical protein